MKIAKSVTLTKEQIDEAIIDFLKKEHIIVPESSIMEFLNSNGSVIVDSSIIKWDTNY